MGDVMLGGFIITKKKGSFLGRVKVDEATLLKVAKILGIEKADQKKLASEFTSIVIYRGGSPLKKVAKKK